MIDLPACYVKEIEARLVRIKHIVNIHTGTRVIDLIETLKSIPPGLRISEVIGPEEEDGPMLMGQLIFVEEKTE